MIKFGFMPCRHSQFVFRRKIQTVGFRKAEYRNSFNVLPWYIIKLKTTLGHILLNKYFNKDKVTS